MYHPRFKGKDTKHKIAFPRKLAHLVSYFMNSDEIFYTCKLDSQIFNHELKNFMRQK